MSELAEIRKELESALFVMRCSSEVPLSSVKTVAESLIKVVDALETNSAHPVTADRFSRR